MQDKIKTFTFSGASPRFTGNSDILNGTWDGDEIKFAVLMENIEKYLDSAVNYQKMLADEKNKAEMYKSLLISLCILLITCCNEEDRNIAKIRMVVSAGSIEPEAIRRFYTKVKLRTDVTQRDIIAFGIHSFEEFMNNDPVDIVRVYTDMADDMIPLVMQNGGIRIMDFIERYQMESKKKAKKNKIMRENGEFINIDMRPHGIKEFLDDRIYKQEDAKIAAAMVLYNNLNGIKENVVFIGPSGCGKTEIFRQLKKLHEDVYIFEMTGVKGAPWGGKGKKTTYFLKSLLERGIPKERIERSIIVLDEFDKMCETRTSAHGENISLEMQGELLPAIEGGEIVVPLENGEEIIDTTKISFVFCGCFDSIRQKKSNTNASVGFEREIKKDINTDEIEVTEDDLIEYGVTPELVGRMSEIVLLEPFTKEDMLDILLNGSDKINPIKKIEEKYHTEIDIDDEKIETLAEQSVGKKMGLRWIQSILQKEMNQKIFNENGFTKDENDKNENQKNKDKDTDIEYIDLE